MHTLPHNPGVKLGYPSPLFYSYTAYQIPPSRMSPPNSLLQSSNGLLHTDGSKTLNNLISLRLGSYFFLPRENCFACLMLLEGRYLLHTVVYCLHLVWMVDILDKFAFIQV